MQIFKTFELLTILNINDLLLFVFFFLKLPLMESDPRPVDPVEMLRLRSGVEVPLVVIVQVVDQIKKMIEDAKNLSDRTIIPTALVEICEFCWHPEAGMNEFRVKDLFVRYPEIADIWFDSASGTIQSTIADIIKNSIGVPLSISYTPDVFVDPLEPLSEAEKMWGPIPLKDPYAEYPGDLRNKINAGYPKNLNELLQENYDIRKAVEDYRKGFGKKEQ